MLKQSTCFEMGAKPQTRGFSLKLLEMIQMFIFWNCSPNLCIQVKDSASQGSVLQSWQHCPSADPACSIRLLFHGMPCTGMLGGSPWLTPQSTTVGIVSCCFVLGKEMQKMDHGYSWWSNFHALATPLWAGWVTFIRKLSVGRARRAPVLPVSVIQGRVGIGLHCLPIHHPPSWISPWLSVLAIPKHRQFPYAPSPASGVLFHETL